MTIVRIDGGVLLIWDNLRGGFPQCNKFKLDSPRMCLSTPLPFVRSNTPQRARMGTRPARGRGSAHVSHLERVEPHAPHRDTRQLCQWRLPRQPSLPGRGCGQRCCFSCPVAGARCSVDAGRLAAWLPTTTAGPMHVILCCFYFESLPYAPLGPRAVALSGRLVVEGAWKEGRAGLVRWWREDGG